MATQKGKEGTTEAPATESATATAAAPEATTAPSAPPSGFRRRVSVSDAPWVEQEVGNIVHGKLLNRYEMSNQSPRRWYYQIELLADCKVRVGKGDDAKVEIARAGDVVNLNENFKLTGLRDVEIPEIIAGAEYQIWAKFESKIKISGNRTMWNVDVQTKMTKKSVNVVRPLPASDLGEVASDDTPF